MQVKVQFARGLEVTKTVDRLPFPGEAFAGEIVESVVKWERPRAGCVAFVKLMPKE